MVRTTTASDHETCQTCGNPRAWHDANKPRHRFARVSDGRLMPDDDETSADGGSGDIPGVVHTSMPMDPVLRLALINKGVITTDDLSAAEKIIAHLTEGVSGG